MRFTRRSTTPTTTLSTSSTALGKKFTKLVESSAIISALSNADSSKDTVESIESSVVKGEPSAPSIIVDIATKKSLRIRNCGERIGEDIPFIAVLVHTNPYDDSPNKKKSLSKGVLISENFVLATVSSIYHSESFWTVSSVRLGDFVTWNKFANRDRTQTVEIDVDEIFYHKKQDLALIKLKEPVKFTDVIRPACLPLSDSYNYKELKSHLCKRSHTKAPADVSLEFAVSCFRQKGRKKICK